MQGNRLKQYSSLLIIGIILIVIYKTFDISWFSILLNAFFPIIIGGILAYFLEPLVQIVSRLFENIENKFLNKHKRIISVLLVSLVVILLVTLLLTRLIPMVMDYAVEFIRNIDTYVKGFESSINKTFNDPNIAQTIIRFEKTFVNSLKSFSSKDFVELIALAGKTGSTLLTILMGLIFCPYILIEAEKLAVIFDRFMLSFVQKENLDLIHEYAYKSHRIFGKFIYGKFIDSLIIGLIALVGFGLMGLPFFPLLAFVILVTNMIPYFGPFIGGIPVVFIVLLIEGFMPALTCGVFIFALQQFDGLILGPRILGDSVGISPFWIICSITVFGSLFGFIGMFLGVPLICVIRMFFNDFLQYRKNKIIDK